LPLPTQKLINAGKICGVFGIKGWVKVFSFTDVREDILEYSPWLLKKADATRQIDVLEGSKQGKAIIARLDGINTRDESESLVGWDIFIAPERLPKLTEGEYYWSDLIGLNVATTEGVALGIVTALMETGANDVLIVEGERERAIPFLQGQTVVSIDLASNSMIVDWDQEF